MNKLSALSILIFILLLNGVSFGEPNGAILIRQNTRYGHYNVPADAGHHYFNYTEGPTWENKYCAFRLYIDKDDRNAIDIFGKLTPVPILQDFNDASDDPHTLWDWGTDILKVGSTMGCGSFRLFHNGQWINPQLPETLDSLVITIVDSSVETPQVQVGYYGWNTGGGNKITVLWTLSTTYEERATHSELSIIGNYNGKVIAGMSNHAENSNNPNRHTVSIIQDEAPPLLATLGKQSAMPEGYDDSLLMAIYTESSYFDSFAKEGTANIGMVLTPDEENKVKWSIAYSWVKEEDPIFKHDDWKEILIPPTAIAPKDFGISPLSEKTILHSDLTNCIYDLSGRIIGKQTSSAVLNNRCAKGCFILENGKNPTKHGYSVIRLLNARGSQ